MAISTSTAPELTSEQVVRVLTKPLEAKSQFLAAGPRIFDTAGPLRIPSAPGAADLSTIGTDGFTGENELIPEIDYEFGEVGLLPSTMESIKTLTRYSNELSRQSVVSLEAALRDRMVADVAARVDEQFLGEGGDGVTTPKGIFGWTGVQTVTGVGAFSFDAILDGQALALGANVDSGSLRLFIRAEDYIGLRAQKEGGTGRYMVNPDVTQSSEVARIMGIPVIVSNRIPAGSAALVDMSTVAVARDASPSVKILTETFAQYDQQAIRVVSRYDAAPLQPDAVILFSGITQE